MGPSGHFYSGMSLAIRDIYIFHGLTDCQRIPRFWGVTISPRRIISIYHYYFKILEEFTHLKIQVLILMKISY